MRFDNCYVSRYRSLPAASSLDEMSEKLLPFYGTGDSSQDYRITLPMHYHPEVEIIYVERGEWYYRTAEYNYYRKASAGELVIFSPYEPHEASMRAGSDGYYTKCICFDTSILTSLPGSEGQDLTAMLSYDKSPRQINIKRDDAAALGLHSLFDDMLRALDAPEHCKELKFIGSLCLLFGKIIDAGYISLCKLSDSETESSGEIERSFARAVIDYTENHYTESISAKTAALSLSYSEGYFCRMCRRVFKMSYGDYLRRLRISKVCLALNWPISITDAAQACGFSHMSLFSKTFRKYTGMTPTEYKHSVKNKFSNNNADL